MSPRSNSEVDKDLTWIEVLIVQLFLSLSLIYPWGSQESRRSGHLQETPYSQGSPNGLQDVGFYRKSNLRHANLNRSNL